MDDDDADRFDPGDYDRACSYLCHICGEEDDEDDEDEDDE